MKEDKQRRIMKKGLELFCEVGYLNTTVEEITNSLNISKGSFYTHYESKEALLLNVLEYMCSDYEEIIKKVIKDNNSEELDVILEQYINVMIDSILDSRNIISLIQQVFTSNFFKSENVKKAVHKFRAVDIEFVKNFIFKKIEFKYETFDLNLLSEYIISSIHTFIIVKMKDGEIDFILENKERIIKDIKSLLLYGILKEEL